MRSNSIVSIFFLACLFLTGCVSAQERLCLRETCFSVDVMRTEEERAKGLMFRESLPPGRGMFFVFDAEAIYPFWMKNMRFAIDILWLDKNKRVVHLAADVPPCNTDPCAVYRPSARAMYVLEIPAGAAVKNAIRVGDIFRFYD